MRGKATPASCAAASAPHGYRRRPNLTFVWGASSLRRPTPARQLVLRPRLRATEYCSRRPPHRTPPACGAQALGEPQREVCLHVQTRSCRALRGGDGSSYSRCRFRVLQKPVLGTADGEYRHRPGLRGFLLEILRAAMIAMDVT